MRLLLLRHGESESNRRDYQYGSRVLSGELSALQGDEAKVAAEIAAEPNGDTQLTDNGLEQAECVGRYWGPVLRKPAAEGKLHVFVSPMLRNMQTVDPLMRILNETGDGPAAHAQVTAEIRPDMIEVPGLAHPSHRAMWTKVEALAKSGDVAAARATLKAAGGAPWRGAGLSWAEMVRRFPWAIPQPGVPVGDPGGWCTAGFESDSAVAGRVTRVVDWLEGLAATLPPDHTVLFVTHGDTMNRVMNLLMARQFAPPGSQRVVARKGPGGTANWVGMHPKSNTSISSLLLNPGEQLVVEWFHRLDHLGPGTSPNTLARGYQYIGLVDRTKDGNRLGYWGLNGDRAKL